MNFANEELPWRDETSVFVVRQAEPRYIIPLLDRALELIRQGLEAEGVGPTASAWPHAGAMPVLAATHFIAAAPLNHLPHSRVLKSRRGRPDGEWPDSRLGPSPVLSNVYTDELASPRVPADYVYDVYCHQKAQSDNRYHWEIAWQVAVRRRMPVQNPCYEISMDGTRLDEVYQVVHDRQPLHALLTHVRRLGHFAELGGDPENY